MPAPTTAALYGPSREFWPKNTLTRAQALALPASSSRRAVVAFTKAAVQAAIDNFSDEDWDLGVVVFTQAGNNDEGKGAGAGSTSWLKTGRSGRKMRALVTPLGAWGSCTFTKSMVIDADGVAFGGYEFIAPKSNGLNRGILLRGASNSAIFNMWPLYYWGVQSVDNQAASTIELVNVVLPEGPLKVYTDNSFDSAAIRTASNAPITDVLLTGVYEGPSFREILPAGKKPSEAAHTDSRQISGGSLISNVRQRRSVTWGSTNAAIQSTGALTGYHFEQSLIIGGPSTNKRYPVPEGTSEWRADGSGFVKPNALNGGPTGCTADGLIVIGTVGQFKFTYAKNSWLSEAPQGSQQPSTGATWGVDTTLATKPLSWFDTVAPNYTRAQIKAIFDGSTVIVPEDDYPTAPNLAIPTVTTTKVGLSWSAATDAQGPVSYEVERDGQLVASVDGLTWENSGLPVATKFQYQVFAVDSADQRTGSNVRTVTTGSGTADTTPPSKPTLTVTNLTPTSGTLNWTAATDDIGVTGYDVMVNGRLAQRVSASARSLPATGLTPDTDYDVAVVAFDAAGNRTSSDLLEVTTPGTADTVAPTAPTLAPPTVGVATIDYSWGGASDDRGTISHYLLYLNNAEPVRVTGTSYRATGLNPGAEYQAYVVSYDPAGNASPASNVRTVTTGTETTPPVITLGLPAAGALPGAAVQQFRWMAVDDDSGVAKSSVYGVVDGVELILKEGSDIGDGAWAADIDTSALPLKLTDYFLEAVDKAGNSIRSARVAVTLPVADTTPPTGGISDPTEGSVVVPPFSRVILSASDPESGISSASLRTSTLGELATAEAGAAGTYEADLPVARLEYGANQVFGRIVNGAGLITDTPPVTVIRLGRPRLEAIGVTATSATLVGGPAANTAGVIGYELHRAGVLFKRAETILELANVTVSDLVAASEYEFALYSVGAGETLSEPAIAKFSTSPKQLDVVPSWFPTGPKPAEGAAGPVNGRVLVRYSSDVRTTDGRELTLTQQVVNAVDGRFEDPSTGELWRGYRSPNPADYIEWIEQFLGPDGRRSERIRKFRFPPTATGPMVAYLDRIWLDDAPAGTSLPVWAQELDAKVARVEAAALILGDGGFLEASQKGVANGVASLGGGGKVPVAELPAASSQSSGIVSPADKERIDGAMQPADVTTPRLQGNLTALSRIAPKKWGTS